MRLLPRFMADVRAWRATGRRAHACEARRRVYRTLVQRHGIDRVIARARRIAAVLDRAEDAALSGVVALLALAAWGLFFAIVAG